MTQETFFSRQPEWERCQRLVSGLEKLRDGGSSLMHAHLPIDVLQMVFHRLLGDMATRSNGFVTQPMQNQIDDLFFSSISVAKLYQRTTRPSASRCGKTSDVEPTVHAIGSAATILKIKRLTRFARATPGADPATKVIRMDAVAYGTILQFLSRLAEIFQDLAVDKFDLPCRIRGRHKPRNAVDDQA